MSDIFGLCQCRRCDCQIATQEHLCRVCDTEDPPEPPSAEDFTDLELIVQIADEGEDEAREELLRRGWDAEVIEAAAKRRAAARRSAARLGNFTTGDLVVVKRGSRKPKLGSFMGYVTVDGEEMCKVAIAHGHVILDPTKAVAFDGDVSSLS